MSNDKLKDLFHEKLYNHEIEVQDSDWEIISKRLKKKQRRKIIPLFYIYGTTGIVAALLIVMFLLKPDTTNPNDNTIAKSITTNKKTAKSEKNNTIISTNPNKPVSTNIIAAPNNSISAEYYQNNNYNSEFIQNQDTNIDINEDIIPEPADKTEETKTTEFIDEPKQVPANNQAANQPSNNDEWWNQSQPDAETQNKKSKHAWTLAVVSGNNIGNNSTISDFTNDAESKQYGSADFANSPLLQGTPNLAPESLGTSKYAVTDKTDLKHNRPLNFGIRLKKNISKRLVIKTGLSYSYFLSEFNNTDRKIQQKIHYIGIPVGIEFLLLNKNNFNIYASGEFTIEKGISYSYKESAMEISGIKDNITENGSVRGLQFSANAGFGISYNFLKNIGIYAEPNAVYYINDNRQPQSFRTEKPFNIGLNIGLKYDF
ncbi:MAG: PorT family protein [Prevotellaceae bacterium]|jgi:hypothetical protein|nr:PorT family protein [Prevotellaceae bacterium]